MMDDGRSIVMVYVPLVHPTRGVWARLIPLDEEFVPSFEARLTKAGEHPMWLNLSEAMTGTAQDHRFMACVHEILYRHAGNATDARQAMIDLVREDTP